MTQRCVGGDGSHCSHADNDHCCICGYDAEDELGRQIKAVSEFMLRYTGDKSPEEVAVIPLRAKLLIQRAREFGQRPRLEHKHD